MRRLLIGVALAAALAWVGWQVAAMERLAATGRPVLFEMGTVDPRSLIQGDYMVLSYRVVQGVSRLNIAEAAESGELVVTVDEHGVARSARLARAEETLAANEVLVNYHRGRWSPTVGPESFFFQEGEAETYAAARYAELRVASDGKTLLVALRDAEREPLGRPAIR